MLFALAFHACDTVDLPEEGSIPDATPPMAKFSYAANEADFHEIQFTNLSTSATDYQWDFGDGATSTAVNPSHVYADEGDYTVTLTASDKLGATSTYSETITVKKPETNFEPIILNPGFDEEGNDSYRDHWRNGDLGGVIQITSSPIHAGVRAAKLPSSGDRIGYQLITVEKNKSYTVSFWYTMKDSPAGTLRVAILAGHVTDPALVDASIIESVILNDQSDPNTYVEASITFNSGDNTEVAIYFDNKDVECRVDTFSIKEN